MNQTWWIDDLTIADGRLATSVSIPPKNEIQFSISPNPMNDEITIRFQDQMVGTKCISVFSLNGRLVYQNVNDDQVIQFAFPFQAGFYIIHVVDENSTRHLGRFVKLN